LDAFIESDISSLQQAIGTSAVWKSLSWPMKRDEAKLPRVPADARIYAVGDIHGRLDLLDQLLSRIDTHRNAHPIAQPLEVFLGDYIDRGPASRDVIGRLISRTSTRGAVCLQGNHEILLHQFLDDPATLEEWGRYGGLATLMSYGLTPSVKPDRDEQFGLATDLKRALPSAHRDFLASLALCFTCGDFFFVHAGVRPRIPLQRQRADDLLWIRDDFLLWEQEFDKIIVHGHTPVLEPEIRSNRINIDTGAYATGRLTCLVLEGNSMSFL
jgi:serine/threonine protein phosphatase 1